MIVIVSILSLTALCFGVFSFWVAGLWPYYTPAALAITLLWMHVADGRNRYVARTMVRSFPNMLSANEREMFLGSPSVFVPQLRSQHPLFSGGDVVSVVQTAAGMALACGVLSVYRQAWVPALLSFGVFLYALLGPLANAFPAASHVDSEARAIGRCLARCRASRGAANPVAPEVSQDIDLCYWRILNKLHSLSAAPAPDARKASCTPQDPRASDDPPQSREKNEVSVS
jgi:hypothetical protein